MTKLRERSFVACPYNLAQKYLADTVEAQAESGKTRVLTLRAGGELHKNVVVTFAFGEDPMHFDRPWRVHWTPEGGGPFPDFDGELTVRADEDYTSSILELSGAYAPPGGALGQMFDHAVGSRIASSTAQALLAEIGAGMVERYARDERAKTAGETTGG